MSTPNSIYYVGLRPEELLGGEPRYIYGLRRDDDGTLYINRFDQIGNETWQVNRPGDPAEDYTGFEVGVDFYDGRNEDHTIEYDNLIYEQYRWDGRFISYYLDNETGQLVARVAGSYNYPEGP